MAEFTITIPLAKSCNPMTSPIWTCNECCTTSPHQARSSWSAGPEDTVLARPVPFVSGDPALLPCCRHSTRRARLHRRHQARPDRIPVESNRLPDPRQSRTSEPGGQHQGPHCTADCAGCRGGWGIAPKRARHRRHRWVYWCGARHGLCSQRAQVGPPTCTVRERVCSVSASCEPNFTKPKYDSLHRRSFARKITHISTNLCAPNRGNLALPGATSSCQTTQQKRKVPKSERLVHALNR